MIADITYLDYQVPFFFDWKPGVKYKVCDKGRRSGITRGGTHAVCEWLIDGHGPVLWGETTHGNIERYFERYFYPLLDSNKIIHKFDRQAKKLTIKGQYCDFRSEDNPENWEGFGYRYIFLNEAGIILKNRNLYINSVLPMLLDYPDSKLIAAGVPKGKLLKDGSEHPFYTLAKRAMEGHPQYEHLHITSYDNPLLSTDDIKALEQEIELFSPEQVRQEIYGEFIESDAMNPFAHQYLPAKHESMKAVFNPQRRLTISTDFNINPFAVTFSHIWKDQQGDHDHQFDEAEIKNGSVPAMVDLIKFRYGHQIHSAILTGDAMGKAGQISQRDNASIYEQLLRGLGMSKSQLRVSGNPTHENSRADLNFMLYHHPDFIINPEKCPNTCRDMRSVQCDTFGSIIKRNRHDLNQRADYLDAVRYKVHNCEKDFIKMHSTYTKNALHLS